MGDRFYRALRAFGRPIVFSAARLHVLHAGRAALPGGCLLAANHHSYFDATILIGTVEREIDWLSIVECFENPWLRGFMQGMNCLPLNRYRPDPVAVRNVMRRVRAGRMVGIFPEGGLRSVRNSVVCGGGFSPGVIQLARLTGVPVLPVVVLGAGQYQHPAAWLPLGRTLVTVNFGEPLHFSPEPEDDRSMQAGRERLSHAFQILFRETMNHLAGAEPAADAWWRKNYAGNVG